MNIADFIEELTRSFDIDYELNGGSLPVDAKDSYTVKDDTFALPEPTKDGYAFAGWYEASDLSGAKTTEIEVGSLGDRRFFASWVLDNSVALEYVAVNGYLAVWHDEDGGYYHAYVNYGTDFSGLSSGNISATPAEGTSGVNIAKADDDSSGATWTITVTSGTASKNYTLRLEIMQLHVASGEELQTGHASPASLDGLTEAEEYKIDDCRQWFVNGDGGGEFPADFSCEAELVTGQGTVAADGFKVSYIPAPEDAENDVRIDIWGASGGLRTLEPVELTIEVGALLESQSVVESPTSSFDKYTQNKAELTLVLYGNLVTGVIVDGESLSAQEYSLSEITSDGKSVLTLEEGTVMSLDEESIRMNELQCGRPLQRLR